MANSAVSPRQHIMRFMGSVQVARAISAVAELGVADALADGDRKSTRLNSSHRT